jgi:hypothetical protein
LKRPDRTSLNQSVDPEETFHFAAACVSRSVKVNPYWGKVKSGCYAPGRFVVPGRAVAQRPGE